MSDAAITGRRIWTDQPQFAAVIDRGNSLTVGLSRLVLPAAGAFDLALGSPAAYVGTVNKNPTGFSWASRAALALTDFPTTRYTCFFLAYTYTAGAAPADEPRMVSRSDGASTYNQNYCLNLNSGTTPRAGHRNASGGAYRYVQSSISVAAGALCAGASTYDGTNILVYTNGVNGGSISATDPVTSLGGSGATQIGNSDGTDRPANVQYVGPGVQLAAIWNRALSAAEILSLSRNPWQLFQPLPRRVFGVVAGGSAFTSSFSALFGASGASGASKSVALGLSAIAGSVGSASGTKSASAGISAIAGLLAAMETAGLGTTDFNAIAGALVSVTHSTARLSTIEGKVGSIGSVVGLRGAISSLQAIAGAVASIAGTTSLDRTSSFAAIAGAAAALSKTTARIAELAARAGVLGTNTAATIRAAQIAAVAGLRAAIVGLNGEDVDTLLTVAVSAQAAYECVASARAAYNCTISEAIAA